MEKFVHLNLPRLERLKVRMIQFSTFGKSISALILQLTLLQIIDDCASTYRDLRILMTKSKQLSNRLVASFSFGLEFEGFVAGQESES